MQRIGAPYSSGDNVAGVRRVSVACNGARRAYSHSLEGVVVAGPDGSANRPAIVTVDDDSSVSRAVARDLRRQYGAEHRIVRGESGAQTLEALRELKLRASRWR